MSTEVNNPLYKSLLSDVNNANILVVGAGGVGCELLKNLVLTGFCNIEVIDLDTIDVSNLNRQFLFQKKHVGKAKATVAKESVLKLCPSANIVARHDSIFNPHYNMQYFKQFDLVMNALDNRAARNHVNRMCLAADIPLIESGSAGYLGQVTVIKKGLTECYECQPAPRQKTFPGCTIRNTPSELIHCIVWAKYLFNQLFGEEDADQDVSPDTADPEAAQDKEENGTSSGDNGTTPSLADIQRRSTREWARECDYDAEKIFNKLFHSDITYLLSMDKLWQKRTPPEPVLWSECQDVQSRSLDQQTVLTLQENTKVFAESITTLKEQFKEQGESGMLVWDKDDSAAMNFTASVANIRAHIFHIQNKSRFEVKSMAGNIIPAIATTNAIVAGLIVMQALFLIRKQMSGCRSVYVWKAANHAKKLLIPCSLDPPKHGCYVCAEKPEITLQLDTTKLTCELLRDKILKSHLGMLAPDVEILDGRGTILISSDEDEENVNMDKTLDYFNITHGTRLRADDFLQNYDIVLNILQEENLPADQLFKVAETKGVIGASVEEEKSSEKPEDVRKPDSNTNNNIEVIEDIDELNVDSEESRKRKLSSPSHSNSQNSSKRLKQSENNVINVDNDDTIILD